MSSLWRASDFVGKWSSHSLPFYASSLLFIFIIICYHFQHFVLFPDPMIRINGTSSCTGSPKSPFRCLDCLHLILINYTSSWIIRSNYSELKWFLLIAFFWAQIISPNCIFPSRHWPAAGTVKCRLNLEIVFLLLLSVTQWLWCSS